MTPILPFLQDGRLPQDVKEVRKRAARFTILNYTLYKKGFSVPYLKCVNEEEAIHIFWKRSMKEFMETMQARDP